jgi:hypothetical protein
MWITRILEFCLVMAVQAHSQGVSGGIPRTRSPEHKPDTPSQCRFSDGNTIIATLSPGEARTIALVTDNDLVTANEIKVPAGRNTISAVTDFHDNWTLILRLQNGKRKFWELPSESVRKLASADEAGTISFDQEVGRCSMHWNLETSNTLITLDFTEKNAASPLH